MKFTVFAITFLMLVCSAFAETKIVVADMEKAILAHPNTQMNKETLVKKQKSFEAERDIRRDKINVMVKDLGDLLKEANNDVLSDAMRNKKLEEAQEVEQKIRVEEQDLRNLLGELQRQLQELELELFVGVMNEVSAELTKISIREKYDIVLDKSGFRAGAPVTIVAYASSALDIADELVAAVKGIKKEVNETGADFSEEGAVETEFPLTLPGTVN